MYRAFFCMFTATCLSLKLGFVGISLTARLYADTSDSMRIYRQNTLVVIDL